jgi:hypothetical protein
MIICSRCGSEDICELQWHHVNEYVEVKGQVYHKMEEGNYFNSSYCDNDYQCLNCLRTEGLKCSDVETKDFSNKQKRSKDGI